MKRTEMRIFICDDDDMNRGINQTIVKIIGEKHKLDLKIYAYSEYNASAKELVESGKIDIAILDIELPEIDGITIARSINQYNSEIPIIFVSEYKKYKECAWDVMAIGFVEKPTNTQKFETLFMRAAVLAMNKIEKENSRFLPIIVDKKQVRLRVENVIYIQKVARKVEFVTRKGIYSTFGTISQYESRLSTKFLKVNQGTFVNKSFIERIDSNNVYMITGEDFAIGITYKMKVMEYASTM